ncbi:hypothetical protein KP509_09G059300 [Ceratopteris richardii]|uniref:Glycosyltransferase 61 catalytic domain-containing protein n=1 Tax=Ceratopteris richardii TaxID=49495 RepID=A0A8T2U1M7_CERRI|nr:hypothetical protein KP509_09G059300 [Ceratopteris richardii]
MTSKAHLRQLDLFFTKYIALNLRPSSHRILVIFVCLLIFMICFSLQLAYRVMPSCNLLSPEITFTGRRLQTASLKLVQIRSVPKRLIEEARSWDDDLQCDRSNNRTDVCVARGNVLVVGGGGGLGRDYEVFVFADGGPERQERVKPYTRKWESSVMSTIDEVKIRKLVANGSGTGNKVVRSELSSRADNRGYGFDHGPLLSDGSRSTGNKRKNKKRGQSKKSLSICDIRHEVPAIIFSTGGYTGNVYHEFNDGLIPLFLTAQQYSPPQGQVVLVILEYHPWWMTKYSEVISQITNYTVIDLARDARRHCFPEVTVGLRIHGELSIDSHLADDGATMEGFQRLLSTAYGWRSRAEIEQRDGAVSNPVTQPKLLILSRNGSRILLNQDDVVSLAADIGFSVQVMSPTPMTEMADIYASVNTCDLMMGVHGAAMTHLLFLRPGKTLIQVVPLGTDWAAEAYYGEPARKLGLHYVQYKVSPQESSLSELYDSHDPVLMDPASVNRRGWRETKRVYLDGQNVTISLTRMAVILRAAYARACTDVRVDG